MQVWQRFPCDSDDAWGQFNDWLHRDPRPDVFEYAQWDTSVGKPVLTWAVENLWDSRAKAYDEWRQAHAIRKVFPVTSTLWITTYRLVKCELDKLEAAQARAGDAPGFMSLRDITQLMRLLRDVERSAATVKLIEREQAKSGAVLQDFSKLTIEEMRTLDMLMSKVSVE